MKRLLIFICIVIFLIGGVILTIGISNSSKNKNIITKEYEVDDFNNLNIDISTANLAIKKAEDGKNKVICVEREKEYHEVSVKNNTLSVKSIDKKRWYERIFNFDFSEMSVTIYLKDNNYNELNIDISTGNTSIDKGFLFESLHFEGSTGNVEILSNVNTLVDMTLSTGNIKLQDMNTKNIELEASTGNIRLNNVNVEEDIRINVSTGKIYLDNVTAVNGTLESSTGKMFLTNAILSGNLNIKATTGDIKFDGSDAANISAKTSTGDVTGSILTDKMYSCKTSTGKIQVPDSIPGGTFKIETSTGDIIIQIK